MSVTNYHRFKPHTVFGLIGTGNGIEFITRKCQERRYVAITAAQLIIIWDIKKQVQVASLLCPDFSGLCCALSSRPSSDGTGNNTHLAAGYSTGHVVLYSIKESERAIDPTVFSGHRGAVSCLSWDDQGMRLASAGTDGEIVIWDAISERGVVRLRGHRGIVTRVVFLRERDVLVSSGKDGVIKFWDIASGHCFRTVTPSTTEVWDIALVKDDTRLVVGGNDANLHVYSLQFTDTKLPGAEEPAADDSQEGRKMFCLDTQGDDTATAAEAAEEPELPEDDASVLRVERIGELQRSRANRVMGLRRAGPMLVCYSKHNTVDIFRIFSDDEVKEKIRRRVKKTRKRLREAGELETETAACETAQLVDEMRRATPLQLHTKLAAVCVAHNNMELFVAGLYSDNSAAVLRWTEDTTAPVTVADSTVCQLTTAGHRSEVRQVSFTSVGDQIVTLSNEALKTWHRSEYECQCINTAPLRDVVRVMCLAPGDKHVVLGTASGHLQLLELASGQMLDDISAHNLTGDGVADKKEVSALAVTADNKGLLSGGTNGNVRFWNFELVSNEDGGRRLGLEPTEVTVSVSDSVTAIECSPDGRLVAVATLDNKETLYYSDTMKLHQQLYGKSMPCRCMAFTDDGEILVTGSMDSSLRIYGTDFGDMRKLLKNAHTGGVTCIQFQSNTRLYFTAGHDGFINYWDASNFQRILTLKGHHGIIRCLAMPPKGNWLVTGGQDSSIRLWERTDELLELAEEREEERRKQEEEEEGEDGLSGQKRHVEGETKDAEAVRASRFTYKTEEAVDMILAALRMYQQWLADPEIAPHYLMLTYNIKDPLLCFNEVLNRIKPSELEECIVQLELNDVLGVLVVLCRLGERGQLTEVSVRVALVAVRTNMAQLLACRTAAPLLRSLNRHVHVFTKHLQDTTGFNVAGLRQCVIRHEKRQETKLFAEAMDRLSLNKRRKKKRENATKRAMISL